MYVYLCPEIAKMMGQICKHRRTNKEMQMNTSVLVQQGTHFKFEAPWNIGDSVHEQITHLALKILRRQVGLDALSRAP